MRKQFVKLCLPLLLFFLLLGVGRFEVKAATNEAGKPVLAGEIKVIKSRKELVKEFGKNILRFKRKFRLYISKNVLSSFHGKQYEYFWNKLYEDPDVNDIFWDGQFDHKNSWYYDYGTYWAWDVRMKKYRSGYKELREMDEFTDKWIKKNIRKNMTTEEKVRKINDFIVAKYPYSYGEKGKDWYYKNNGKAKLGNYSVYGSFSLLYKNGGVCNAKAVLFCRLAKKAGIKAMYISGYAEKEAHAWNLVKIGKNWYHLDVTWSRVTETEDLKGPWWNDRRYYLKSDKTMRKLQRKWRKADYPSAKKDYPKIPGVTGASESVLDRAS